jgi:hypothetical protein
MKAPTKKEQCVHFWIIESSDEATSIGRCKTCGMVREFINDWNTVLENVSKTNNSKPSIKSDIPV